MSEPTRSAEAEVEQKMRLDSDEAEMTMMEGLKNRALVQDGADQ